MDTPFTSRALNSLEYRLGGRLPRPVSEAARRLLTEIKIARASRRNLARFAGLRGPGLRLHLGCGADVRAGWVNVDADLNGDGKPESSDYYQYDLRRGIPLPDGSCSVVYSSHFFEHLTNEYGRKLFNESFRVLEPGGLFRVALPDWRKFFGEYLADDRAVWRLLPVEEMFPGRSVTSVPFGEMMDRNIYQGGEHVCFYDEERTIGILTEVGFSGARAVEYDARFDPADELRRERSFFITATKP